MSHDFARDLRRNATDPENRLWKPLRSRHLAGFKFRRQRPIGRYIADFVCLERKLIIEIDGGQHADSVTDTERTRWLVGHGWRVARFWNNQVETSLDGVLSEILRVLEDV